LNGSISTTIDIQIIAKDDYTNLGYILNGFDANQDGVEDLFIGSPFAGPLQEGKVWIFLSNRTFTSGMTLTDDEANVTLSGEQEWSWFGYDFLVATTSSSRTLLLVGAPQMPVINQTTYEWINAVGKLYAFDLIALLNGQSFNQALIFSIIGGDEFDQLALSFDFTIEFQSSKDVLALSLPTRKSKELLHYQAGEVGLIANIGDLSGTLTYANLRMLSSIQGDEDFARLGWSVQFIQFKSNSVTGLVVSEPYRRSGIHPETGAVYIWTG
jgi:hypothetical protein